MRGPHALTPIRGAVYTGGLSSTGTIDFPPLWHLGSGLPWTAAALVYNIGINDLYGVVCKMDAQSGGNSEFCMGIAGSVFAARGADVGVVGGVGAPTANTWRLIASGGDASGYSVFDGVNFGTGGGTYTTDSGSGCGFSVGNFRPNGSYTCDMYIAGAWVWARRLPEAAIRAMAFGRHPESIDPQSIAFAYYPIGISVPTAWQVDQISGMAGQPSGSLARVPVPPPVSFFASPLAPRLRRFAGTSPPPPPTVGAFKLVGGHNRLAGRGGLAA